MGRRYGLPLAGSGSLQAKPRQAVAHLDVVEVFEGVARPPLMLQTPALDCYAAAARLIAAGGKALPNQRRGKYYRCRCPRLQYLLWACQPDVTAGVTVSQDGRQGQTQAKACWVLTRVPPVAFPLAEPQAGPVVYHQFAIRAAPVACRQAVAPAGPMAHQAVWVAH